MKGLIVIAFAFAACNADTGRMLGGTTGGTTGGGPRDLSAAENGDMALPDGGPNMSCLADAPDQAGCSCPMMGATRPCYPADPSTRNIGVCKDGMQTCDGSGEFAAWGMCTGAVTPVAEVCTDGIDNSCDGKIDCADASCATNAACNTGCTDGQTRPCYTGPSGTEGVGTCKAGTQTCSGGQWPSTCPEGDVDKPKNTGGLVPMDQCCPCTAGDCGNPGCCAETVCAGNAACAGLICKPLPSSCMGMVNADCDDFPEDCDEPCCKCTNCP